MKWKENRRKNIYEEKGMKGWCAILIEIRTPCRLGEPIGYNGKSLIFSGYIIYKFLGAYEVHYFFDDPRKHIIESGKVVIAYPKDFNCHYLYSIHESLLKVKRLAEHGYKRKGRGHFMGMNSVNGVLYADFCLESHYFSHYRYECDEQGHYIENGGIIGPPTAEDEKIEAMMFKSNKVLAPIQETKLQRDKWFIPGQINLFDML